jgi:hypothetical protein
MKPLNYDNSPCSPISSNCVIWQGPDIPCIKLCAGDTISDVIFKLATELCTVLDTLNVTNYDLSCFNLTACGPNDFTALIQFLIEQICALQTEVDTLADPATNGTTTSVTKSDPLVTVAPCFVVGNVTVMTVSEYAQAIGIRVCSLVSQIATINSQLVTIDSRLTALESVTPPTFTLPDISVQECDLSSTITAPGSYPMDDVLDALINDTTYGFCALRNVTGMPAAILAAVQSQCIDDSDISLVYGTPFSTAYSGSWIAVATVDTIADAINNIWISLCDVYQYVSTIAVTVNDTATINLSVTSGPSYGITADITDTGWVDLNGFAFYSGVTKPQCRRIGNQIHFRGTVFIPLENPSSPGSVVTLTSTSAYNSVGGCATWSGTGGCSIDSNGAIQFNNGGSVIPTSVTSGNLDGIYSLGWIIATRGIDVDATYGTSLSSAMNVMVTATKGLTVALVHDIEITATRGTGVQGNSPLRLITSNVRAGEYLPNYIATATDIHNAPSNANFPLVSNTFNLTWPFSCDAGNEEEVGGFAFKLDGLIAYLDPCNAERNFSVTC